MRSLFLLAALTLTFCQPAHADVQGRGTIPTYTAPGGRVFTDLKNMIILYSQLNASGVAKYSTFRKAGTTTGYQVTAGKTLTIWGCNSMISTATSGAVSIGYADADAGFSGTVPANVANSWQTSGGVSFIGTATPLDKYWVSNPIVWTVPAAKYPLLFCGAQTLFVEAICFGSES